MNSKRTTASLAAAVMTAVTAGAGTIGEAMKDWKDAKDLSALSSSVYDGKEIRNDFFGYADIESGRRPAADDLYWIASNSKAIACALVLTYVEEGKIALEDPVEKYLPEWKNIKVKRDNGTVEELKSKPTVRQLMSHRSGLRFFPVMPISQFPMRMLSQKAIDYGLQTQPGEAYAYSNWGIDCAVAICEVIGGKGWDHLLKERVLDPLGMKETLFFPNAADVKRLVSCYKVSDKGATKVETVGQLTFPYDKPPVYAEAGGGLFSTVGDMMKFYRMLAGRGVSAEGRRLFSEKTMEEWYGTSAWWKKNLPDVRYTLGADVDPKRGLIGHGGAWQTFAQSNWKAGTARVYFVQQEDGSVRSGARRKAWDKATEPYFLATGTAVEGMQQRK